MGMNRVQFQPGLSMAKFVDRYGSEAHCEAALVAARWPEDFAGRRVGLRRTAPLPVQVGAIGNAASVVINVASSAAPFSSRLSCRYGANWLPCTC